jgi:hypothetical protein
MRFPLINAGLVWPEAYLFDTLFVGGLLNSHDGGCNNLGLVFFEPSFEEVMQGNAFVLILRNTSLSRLLFPVRPICN